MESVINNAAVFHSCNFIKDTPTQVFSCEYCEIFKNSFFNRAPLLTASVLWTITMLNCNLVLGNLLWTIWILLTFLVMQCSMESASYCCLRKAVSSNFFQEVLLINISSNYANFFQRFLFPRFLLIEDYGKCALRKEPVIGCSLIKHIFRKSYWQTPLTLRAL